MGVNAGCCVTEPSNCIPEGHLTLAPLVVRQVARQLSISSLPPSQHLPFPPSLLHLQGQVGFLDDWRRMNVAITRARYALFVFGHATTLRADPHWDSYLGWLAERGCVVSQQHLQG